MKRLFTVLLLFLFITSISACSKSFSKGETETKKTGLVQRERVELSQAERYKLTNQIRKIPVDTKQEFNTKYEAWKATWADPKLSKHSDPNMYAKSKQYEEFVDYCKKQDRAIWPLLFERFEQGDSLVQIPILELVEPYYGNLLIEIREESTKEKYTAEGVYTAPSAEANMMKYIKALLSKSENSDENIQKSAALLFEDAKLAAEMENNLYNKDIIFSEVFEDPNAKLDFSHIVKVHYLISASDQDLDQRVSDLVRHEGLYLLPVLNEKGMTVGMAGLRKIVPLAEVPDAIKNEEDIIDTHTNHVGKWEVVRFYKNSISEVLSDKANLNLLTGDSIKSMMYVELPIIKTTGLLYVLENEEKFVPFIHNNVRCAVSKFISGRDIVQQLIDASKSSDAEGA